MRRIVLVIGMLALASCARLPTVQEANDTVLLLRSYEDWAWVWAVGLIWADLVLPIPQAAVITALGVIYGATIGGLVGSVGLITMGWLGYALMRTSARHLAHRFAGPRLRKMERLFDGGGVWAIVLTRSLPYSIPEIMVFLAGIAAMPPRKFNLALVVGSVPTAFAFAAIGAGWADRPVLALAVSYVLPIVLVPVALYLLRRRA